MLTLNQKLAGALSQSTTKSVKLSLDWLLQVQMPSGRLKQCSSDKTFSTTKSNGQSVTFSKGRYTLFSPILESD
jgi:predicted oxidoreductase (fatty acid repression mutant protein)